MKMMKKPDKMIACKDYKWIEKVRQDQSEKAWRKYASKFSIAVMRILRLDGIKQEDLAQKIHLNDEDLTDILKGKVNLDLKTMVAIQDALGEEIISIKNIDITRMYKNCTIFVTSNQILSSPQWNVIDATEVQQLTLEDYSIKLEIDNLKEKKGNVYEFEFSI